MKDEWISVQEGLPPKGITVIGYFPDKDESGKNVSTAIRWDDKLISDAGNSTAYCFCPTHWMSMPAPPEIIDAYDFCSQPDFAQKKMIGTKVETLHFGVGVVAKTDDERVMVKVSVKCKNNKCERDIYLTDAFTTGDLGNVYDKTGKYHGNVSNNVFNFCDCK